jgi:hypothetical protein
MANSFSKEERVAFEDLLEGFQDALVLSRNVAVYNTDQTMMERTNNVIWRPMPYIAVSYNGTDMTGNFDDYTQLTVPATIGYQKSVPWIMSATELRDALQEGRLGDAAKQKLASDINVAVLTVAGQQGTLAIKRAAATGFDDVALVEAVMNETGVPMEDRYLALSTRDYNGMASDLAKNTRSFGNDISDSALRRAFVGRVASFDTYKLDYALRKTAAAGGGGIQVSTLAAAGNYWVPKATSVAATGEVSNVDNRYQTITVTSSASVAAGDSFTIGGVFAVHHITKQSTGLLRTFRVISVPAGGTTLVISPPIISNQGGSDAEAQYQNVTIPTPSATSPVVFLNTVTGFMNPFWHKDSIEILPGRYAVPTDAGAAVMRASTDQGIELVMTKQYDINTMKTKYRLDTLFGVVNTQPQMSGIVMFSQT